jgi:hypothetical protein
MRKQDKQEYEEVTPQRWEDENRRQQRREAEARKRRQRDERED